MSGIMSQYILEDDNVECVYPDIGHCPVRCMSRSYAPQFVRFRHLEESIREMRNTLDTVLDYVIRGAKSSSTSDSDKKSKKGKKSRAGSRSGSDVIGQDQLDIQASLERDFSELLTWKHMDDEGGRPKKPKCCSVILKSATSSEDGGTSERETSGDEHTGATDGDDIVHKVSQVIDEMAQVADDIQATAEITKQVVADMPGMQAQNLRSEVENAGQPAEEEDENAEPEYIRDFLFFFNEMNDVD